MAHVDIEGFHVTFVMQTVNNGRMNHRNGAARQCGRPRHRVERL